MYEQIIAKTRLLQGDENGNRLLLFKNNELISLSSETRKMGSGDGAIVNFKNARNCTILISPKARFYGCKFEFSNSEESIIIIDESIHKIFDLNVYIKYSKGSKCIIGRNFSCVSCMLNLSETSDIIIGNDCMFSENVKIWNWDGHTILNEEGNCINHAKSILIGDHVWIGMDASLAKGSKINENSIVGQKSLITKSFDESNVVIAGIPAKIIKRNVNWDRTPSSIWKANVTE